MTMFKNGDIVRIANTSQNRNSYSARVVQNIGKEFEVVAAGTSTSKFKNFPGLNGNN